MSAADSNLAPTKFDYVVAVTQDSINASLAQYLYDGVGEATLCYVYDATGTLNRVLYATFVETQTDPFEIPADTPSTDHRIQTLNDAGFAFAVKVRLGLPPGVAPSDLAPIVVLQPRQSKVVYTMLFAEFEATALNYGPRGSMTWFNQSQPAGTAWKFTGTVDLDFANAAFASLPEPVQRRLQDIGDAQMFSAQQLYYDLNSTDLEQGFQFENIVSNSALDTFMIGDFLNTYLAQLAGGEVLGYGANQLTATPASSLAVTALNFFTPDAVAGSGAPYTLNYLCAMNNGSLPDTTHADFDWDWVEPSEVSQYDGVAALNRDTLANYLNSAVLPSGGTLLQYVESNCYLPTVTVTHSGLDLDFAWGMAAGTPTIQIAPALAGQPILLAYSYGSPMASDEAGLDGVLGKMEMSSAYSMSINCSGAQMTVTQHLVVYVYARISAKSASGNVIDRTITDTYTIGVDAAGSLVALLESSFTIDESQSLDTTGDFAFFTDLPELIDDVNAWKDKNVGNQLTDVPVAFIQNFVFPGGKTFSFADAAFSTTMDLVSHITYAD